MGRGLQQEIRQTKPFASLEEEAFLNLLRTTDALARREAELLKAYGLSPSQYNALRILRGAGSEGVTCGEMSERMLTKDPDVTRLIDRLDSRNLIQRSRSDQDRRVVRTTITQPGLDLLAQIDAPMRQVCASLLGHFTREQLREFIALLELARSRTDP